MDKILSFLIDNGYCDQNTNVLNRRVITNPTTKDFTSIFLVSSVVGNIICAIVPIALEFISIYLGWFRIFIISLTIAKEDCPRRIVLDDILFQLSDRDLLQPSTDVMSPNPVNAELQMGIVRNVNFYFEYIIRILT